MSENKPVTIYSTPNCHFCNMAKEYFTVNGISYESFDVSVDSEKRAEMMQKSGQLGVPVILIEDKVIIGFNKPVISDLLGLNDSSKVAA